ncbi:MAG: MFS transporter [Acidimicrobiia bacterium]|nr:MFS transporter [Acidimicrobiia bacterium]
MSTISSIWSNVRHPMKSLRGICGGEAVYPLMILFALNAVDELDRAAFGVLLPEIRDHFDLDLSTTLGLVGLVAVAALALQVPIAQWADRSKRVPLVVGGAIVWGVFSGLTGMATGLIIFGIARSGSALGKAVIDPTHNSLISDYYPIESRSNVFSVHRAANAVGAFVGPISAGLVLGARWISKKFAGNIAGLTRIGANVSIAAAFLAAAFALAPNIYIAVAVNCVISAALAMLAPAIFTGLSLAIPPRARATGYSVASLWIIPGLAVLPMIGWLADKFTIRVGMLVMIPLFVVGGLIQRSIGNVIMEDIGQVWQSAAARSEALYDRRRGNAKLLLLRGVHSGYDGRMVLQGIDLDMEEGEIVALLGTNGAGKSTLLRTISGTLEADRGAVIFDGRDITHAPPNEIAALGIVQMPGGQGVFGSLTVRENLELAGWTHRRDAQGVANARAEVLAMFPILSDRMDEAAVNLSGGQQQMLALAMSFIMRPRILLIDELSLGLAPIIVGQMLPVVERLSKDGVTVVLVEQSVNVALTVAQRAYFLERGEIRFSGPTADLLKRPDILRSVFLSGAAQGGDRAHTSTSVSTQKVALETFGLIAGFGGIRAVDGVSIRVHDREIVGMIGPNGAGKTTLFDLISGFTPIIDGRIEIDGRDVTKTGPSGRAAVGLGRSFQDARLFPELTVRETLAVSLERWVSSRSALVSALYLPPAFESEQSIERRVDELVDLLGLGDYQNKFVRELSTGTRRIVDLACLVAHRPSVILLDEPTSGLAQREVEALSPVVRRLRDEMGAALLIIEHDIPFVSSVADRLIALDQGRVVTEGEPTGVLEHPTVIESYLGTSSAAIARSGQGG